MRKDIARRGFFPLKQVFIYIFCGSFFLLQIPSYKSPRKFVSCWRREIIHFLTFTISKFQHVVHFISVFVWHLAEKIFVFLVILLSAWPWQAEDDQCNGGGHVP